MMTMKGRPVPSLAKPCRSSGELALVALTHRTPENVVIMENIINDNLNSAPSTCLLLMAHLTKWTCLVIGFSS